MDLGKGMHVNMMCALQLFMKSNASMNMDLNKVNIEWSLLLLHKRLLPRVYTYTGAQPCRSTQSL